MSDTIGELHSYNADLKNREIYLHGQHGSFEEDPGVDYRMATTFVKNIRTLDIAGEQPILIHMHSLGGNWADGMAIYDAIKLCRSHVAVLVYGQAESMSSIILQAADLRVMTPNAYFMSHYGFSEFSTDYLSSQNGAKFDKAITNTMFDIYAESCVNGKFFKDHYKTTTTDKVKAFLERKLKSGDWYLNSHESVYYGFADGVLGSRKLENIDKLK